MRAPDGLTLIRWASLAFAAAGPILAVILFSTDHPVLGITAALASIGTTPAGLLSAAFAIPGTSRR